MKGKLGGWSTWLWDWKSAYAYINKIKRHKNKSLKGCEPREEPAKDYIDLVLKKYKWTWKS